MRYYVFDREDDLIIATTDENTARRVSGYYGGYILTEEEFNKIYG